MLQVRLSHIPFDLGGLPFASKPEFTSYFFVCQTHFWSVAEAEDEEKGQFGVLEVQFVEEDPLAHLEKLRRQLPAKTVSLEKTQQYMERVKVSVAAERREAAKREQRRKKLIADEVVLSLDKERADEESKS